MKFDKVIAARNNKTVYRDGDRCIKAFDVSFSKADILNEALNMARIEQTGIKVPRLLEVTTADGQWASIYEYISGRTMAQLMSENPEKKSQYLEQFVEIQLDVQAHTCPMLNQLKDKMQRKISQSNLDATTRYDLHVRLDGMPTHNKICHGDFNPSNIIISDDGTPYIIDWSHVTQGNASADAARTYLLFWLDGDIDGAEAYLNLFAQKSDTAKQYIQQWMPIVSASHLCKGNEEEREFLMRWINVMEGWQ